LSRCLRCCSSYTRAREYAPRTRTRAHAHAHAHALTHFENRRAPAAARTYGVMTMVRRRAFALWLVDVEESKSHAIFHVILWLSYKLYPRLCNPAPRRTIYVTLSPSTIRLLCTIDAAPFNFERTPLMQFIPLPSYIIYFTIIVAPTYRTSRPMNLEIKK
jgi:hypothetical protein